ncbi:Protein CBG27372 [Caenorhabditis briggsae]|uniref:Protein CBG27372 n=1 Tax=Caenorhabditis briggsae TaxID=6238 RepID=B6IGH2_CAEBR|nr:Protein CBG27372 [Caenorhabditis briggsae]CAR99002.1 Protein CBG27372 [Caenorhabditis briggsae]
MNSYLIFDLSIHRIVFVGVLFPSLALYNSEKFFSDYIALLLVDLVALTPPYILIICDNNIRDLIRCRRRKKVVHVLPSDMNSTMK